MLKYNNILRIILVVSIFCVTFPENVLAITEIPMDPPVASESPTTTDTTAEHSVESEDIGVSGSYLSSLFARSNGDIDSAIKSLSEVYKKNPQNMDIANQLMGLYLLSGKVNEAMATASGVAKNNPKDPISALMLSLKAIKDGDIGKASKILDRVSEEESGQLWLPLISAWLDVEQKKLVKPIMIEELSAEVGRAAPIVNYHIALINARAGFINEAANNFKQAITDPTRPPERVMQMLLQFYDENKSPSVLKPLVNKYREANKNAKKIDMPKIDGAKNGAAEVLLTMGSIMLSADVTQDATLYLQLTLYLKPDMEIATLALSQAYSELEQFKISNELLERIPPNSDLYSNAQLYTAINLGRLKKDNEAIAKLNDLISQSPKNVEAYMAKGDLLRIQKNFDEAVRVYKDLLKTLNEEKPRHWPIYFALATCFDQLENWQEAEKSLKRSLELSPNQPDVLNYLGYSYIIRGINLLEAKDLIEKAIKKRPSDPQIMDSMGWALYLLKDYKKAVVYLERAVSLLPADVTVNEHLGDVYWRLGRKTEARFQWDRSLTFVEDSELAEKIQKKLKDGLPEANAVNSNTDKDRITPISTALTE